MTAFSPGSEPSAINTYERLFIWAAQVLQDTAGSDELTPVQNGDRVPRVGVTVARTADGRDHFIVSAYVPVDLTALNDPASKTWMAAQDISDATPHVNLLSN